MLRRHEVYGYISTGLVGPPYLVTLYQFKTGRTIGLHFDDPVNELDSFLPMILY